MVVVDDAVKACLLFYRAERAALYIHWRYKSEGETYRDRDINQPMRYKRNEPKYSRTSGWAEQNNVVSWMECQSVAECQNGAEKAGFGVNAENQEIAGN